MAFRIIIDTLSCVISPCSNAFLSWYVLLCNNILKYAVTVSPERMSKSFEVTGREAILRELSQVWALTRFISYIICYLSLFPSSLYKVVKFGVG